MRTRLSALQSFALIIASCFAAAPACYYPEGNLAVDQVPCNAAVANKGENASACCNNDGNSYCTQNGLCLQGGVLYRSSCTDKSWQSSKCPQLCTDGTSPFFSSITLDTKQSFSNLGQTSLFMNFHECPYMYTWRCEYTDCKSGSFRIPPEELNIILRDSQAPSAVNAIGFANPNSPFLTANTTSSSTSGKATNQNYIVSTASAVSAAPTPLPSGSSNSNTVPIALGIAIPLGVILIASLAGLLYCRRRAISQAKNSAGAMQPSYTVSHGHERSRGELPNHGPVPELKSSGPVLHELAGSGRLGEFGEGRRPRRFP